MKILYLLSGFPALSETFILNEITGLIDLGHDIEIISLYNCEEDKIHDKVRDYNLINKTTYLNWKDIRNNNSDEEILIDLLKYYNLTDVKDLIRILYKEKVETKKVGFKE